MKKNIFFTRLILGSLIFQYFFLFAHRSSAQNSIVREYEDIADKLIRTALTDQKGYKILDDLCKIGHRLSGSENSLRAIYWAKSEMEKLNFQNVRLQPVMVPKWDRGKNESAKIIQSVFFKGKELSIAALCPSVPAKAVTGEILEVRSFDELKENAKKAKGKIIFFNRPMDAGSVNSFGAYGGAVDQRTRGAVEAAKVGGIAVIVRSMTTKNDNVPHTGSMSYADTLQKIPAISIGLIDADFLSDAVKKEPNLKIKIDLNCKTYPEALSYNVIGELKGIEKPDEVIVVGGHFDCWDKGVGAHDDGGGCIQSLEVLDLFNRLGIKPKRTIRCVFFMNEENGLRGGLEYGKYSDTCIESHLAAIESDRGVGSPRGFTIQADQIITEKFKKWLPYLQKAQIEWIQPGGSGSDISPIKKIKSLLGYVPDAQRYFDYHHSANDIFSAVHPREFELGSAAIAILVYLISEEGL